jgi:hypothetical protein
MDAEELAMYRRGKELEDYERKAWDRWKTAAMLQPHTKKAISPLELIKLPFDHEKSNKVDNKKDLEKMEEIHRKWDEYEALKKQKESGSQ